jgi:hypothetical protein
MKYYTSASDTPRLNQSRSYRQVISDTFNLCTTHITAFFKGLWPLALGIGLVMALVLLLIRLSATPVQLLSTLVVGVLIGLLLAAVYMTVTTDLLRAQVEGLVSPSLKRHLKTYLQRSLPVYLLLVIQTAVLVGLGLLSFKYSDAHLYLWLAYVIVVLMLSVPFSLSLAHSCLTHSSALKSLAWGFKRMNQSFGSTLFVNFATGILGVIFVALYCLPVLVLNIVFAASDQAVALGDTTDLPSAIYVLHFVLAMVLSAVSTISLAVYSVAIVLQHYSVAHRQAESSRSLQ